MGKPKKDSVRADIERAEYETVIPDRKDRGTAMSELYALLAGAGGGSLAGAAVGGMLGRRGRRRFPSVSGGALGGAGGALAVGSQLPDRQIRTVRRKKRKKTFFEE